VPDRVDFCRNSDGYVESLYARASEFGAALLRARYSRMLVDLNRAPDDIAPHLVADHPAPRPRPVARRVASLARRLGIDARARGVAWDRSLEGAILYDRLDFETLQERLDAYYWPYYEALGELLRRRIARFGFAVLIDAHSMPRAIPFDLVLSTREGTSASSAIVKTARSALQGDLPPSSSSGSETRWRMGGRSSGNAQGLRLGIDDPFTGGHVVETFGRPRDGIHAVQVEFNRGIFHATRANREHTDAGQSISRPDAQTADQAQLERQRSTPTPPPTYASRLVESRILNLVEAFAALAPSARFSGSATITT
jgi:N-formylglutamate amidohydrolase